MVSKTGTKLCHDKGIAQLFANTQLDLHLCHKKGIQTSIVAIAGGAPRAGNKKGPRVAGL